jgi:hypothetical protein
MEREEQGAEPGGGADSVVAGESARPDMHRYSLLFKGFAPKQGEYQQPRVAQTPQQTHCVP